MSSDTFTRWGVLASGEGGGRIASQFFARSNNPGIEDRILVLNTNRSDIRNTIRRIEDHVDDDVARHALEFGDVAGAGNRPSAGEEAAREDFGRIAGHIESTLEGVDAFLHVATLGGGTGNGSIPYLVEEFKRGANDAIPEWSLGSTHTTVAVWPYYDEPAQRHYNAVTGLSRLLCTDDGSQNADMVILAANSHLDDDAGHDFDVVNERIIEAVDLMIGAGRETRGVIDVQDYVAIPSEIGAYHFTPGLATDVDGSVFELSYAFDRAAENAFVPLDPSTARVAYAVVRAPEEMIDRGDITEPGVTSAFTEWKRENDLTGASGMTSLTPKRERGSGIDVLLMLGGFDLGPLLDHSRDAFEEYKRNVESGQSIASGQRSVDLERVEQNLEQYLELNTGG